jgi:para-nitrobenzyl esterase
MSEDCLSVNVWTPADRSDGRLPVMVWIYGGGFTYGSGSHPSYDGEALARRGVVVVTLNYRVGLFGFMAHPDLTAESARKASGNYALMDQSAALRWVQRKITAFGGDPGRVTVFGQSAGALAITSLMTSPQAKGPFQQAIVQSVGVMRPMSTLHEAEAFGTKVGPRIADLRRLAASALVQRLRDVAPSERDMTSARPLSVIVDGEVIPRDDRRAFASGQFANMPLIAGGNLNEGGGAVRNYPIRTGAEFRDYLARNFNGSQAQALTAYPVPTDADVSQQLAHLYSDTQFNFGTREMLRIAAASQPRTYRYLFKQQRNGASAAPIHGDELQYVFDNLDAPHRGRLRPYNAADSKVAAAMADAWVRFAKTGDPNGGDLPAWPRYDGSREPYMAFGELPKAADGNRTAQLDMIRDYYASPTKVRP